MQDAALVCSREAQRTWGWGMVLGCGGGESLGAERAKEAAAAHRFCHRILAVSFSSVTCAPTPDWRESPGAARAKDAPVFCLTILAISCSSVTCAPTPDWREQHGRRGSRSCGGGHLAGNHLTASWVTRSSAASAARSFF
eukprot:5228-Rhodomonas_salina.1